MFLKLVVFVLFLAFLVNYEKNIHEVTNLEKDKPQVNYTTNITNFFKVPIIDVYDVYEIEGSYNNNDFVKMKNKRFKHFYSNITYNLKDIKDTKIIIIKRRDLI